MKFIRIFLLILIIIGLGLLITQKLWVPSLVTFILSHDEAPAIIPPTQGTGTAITPSPTTTPPQAQEAVVKGTVTLSPTCPVERMPPDPQCAPKPYQTNIRVLSATGKSIKNFQNKSDGTFAITLSAGSYTLQAEGGATYPRCSPVQVTISLEKTKSVDISCDTGIR